MDGAGEEISSSEIDRWDASAYLKKRVPQAQYSRRSFDRVSYRNCLFYLGQQWLRFNRTSQQWRPISTPDWFPKQVTNHYAAAVDIMKSVFMQSDPQSIYTPASADMEDIAAARAAMDISKIIDLEVTQSELESKAAAWLVLTGNTFIVDGYDNDERHGTKFIADMACLDCIKHIPAEQAEGACPHCGGPNLIEARNEDGQAIGKNVPIGRLFSEVASPFEMHFDLVSRSFDESPYVYRARTYPIDVLKDMFPDHAESIKGDDAGIDSGMFYQTALAYVTSATTSSPGNYGGSVGSVDNVPRATLYHLYVRPTKNLPNGGEALICGNTTLWKSELSYHDEEGRPIFPVTHIGFNEVPGRVLSKTPCDDLVFKQVQHNKMEAFIQMAMERISNPVWLLPKSIGIDNISGEPGEKIWYNAFNGVKPERVGGSEVPGSVYRWIETIKQDMKSLSHTDDVMRGKAPEGVPTFGAAQLLLERSFAGFADGLKSWGRAWNKVRRNRLLICREHWTDERTMMVMGKNKEWEAKKFSKDSMQGRINVYLEEASLAPKSKGYEQYMVAQMIERQLIDLSDPAVKMQVMHILDIPQLVEGLDIDIKDAIKEKEDFIQSGQARPREAIDNHQIHMLEHSKTAKSDEFFSWPPGAQNAWIQHIMFHQQVLQKQQEAQQAMDPHVLNAKARLEEIQMELEAMGKQKNIETSNLQQRKGIELQHLQAKKNIDLQAHGIKKGIDSVMSARKPLDNNNFKH